MPLVKFKLHPQYRDWWGEYKRNPTAAGMESYLRVALGAQYNLSPTEDERRTEVTKKFPDPVIPPEIVPDDANAEVILKLHVLNTLGQAYFSDKPVMEFRIKRAVQEVPTYIQIDAIGAIKIGQLADIGFWRAFRRELENQMTDPHVKLFLQLVIGDWIRTGGLKAVIGNPLSAITGWFNKVKPDWADDIEGFTNSLKNVWNRITPDWMNSIDGVRDRVKNVWDWLTPDWMNSINSIKLEFDKFNKWWAAGLTETLKTFKKDYNDNALPLVTSFKKGLIRWNMSGETFIDQQMKLAKIADKPFSYLDEHFTVPLRIMRGDISLRLSTVANYLALFGINEGKKAKKYAERLINTLIQPAEKVSMQTERWGKQVQVTLQEFAQTEFQQAQATVNRIQPIVDAAIELLSIEDPETARLRKEPWGRSAEAYPATTVSLLENGVSYSLPMKVAYPAPVENTLPEIQNASYMIDRIMENLYLGTDGKPINEAIGKDFIMTTDPSKIKGQVKTVESVYNHPSLGTFDDLACNVAFGSAAQDEGSILDTAWSIVSDIPLGVMSLIALRLCRIPYKYLLYPAVFEYTLQAIDWYVSEPEDYTDRFDEFNADFWNKIVQWSERSDQLEPWLPGVFIPSP